MVCSRKLTGPSEKATLLVDVGYSYVVNSIFESWNTYATRPRMQGWSYRVVTDVPVTHCSGGIAGKLLMVQAWAGDAAMPIPNQAVRTAREMHRKLIDTLALLGWGCYHPPDWSA